VFVELASNMPLRNQEFRTREPFDNDDRLTLQRAHGPFKFLNPTTAHFEHSAISSSSKPVDSTTSQDSVDSDVEAKHRHSEANVPTNDVRFLWRSRDNRKGRHPLLVQRPPDGQDGNFRTPRKTSHPMEVLKVVIKTFTYFPVWDISWLVAFIFTWGSVVWVINVRESSMHV
jgi:hypothetical protein